MRGRLKVRARLAMCIWNEWLLFFSVSLILHCETNSFYKWLGYKVRWVHGVVFGALAIKTNDTLDTADQPYASHEFVSHVIAGAIFD